MTTFSLWWWVEPLFLTGWMTIVISAVLAWLLDKLKPNYWANTIILLIGLLPWVIVVLSIVIWIFSNIFIIIWW